MIGGYERFGAVSLGLLSDRPLHRFLRAHGAVLGPPGPRTQAIAVWGRKRAARRGMRMAARFGLPLLSFEDAFLRGLRAEDAPLGISWDDQGIHFDPQHPSRLETLLAAGAASGLGGDLIARWRALDLSKHNAWPQVAAPPKGAFVLVVDQSRGDASVLCSGADHGRFEEMLQAARDDHPGLPIYVRPHPLSDGYLCREGVHISPPDQSPGPWLRAARAVYTVSSQLGFEAILHGQKPVLFGQPFYAGWGLSEDRHGAPGRRGRMRSAERLAEAAFLDYSLWYDPIMDRAANTDQVMDLLSARRRIYSLSHNPMQLTHMRAWKRGRVRDFLKTGGQRPVFRKAPKAGGGVHIRWGAGQADMRMEDGFIRSAGLGAQLVPPCSLILDKRGLYFDPNHKSDLDHLITEAAAQSDTARAKALLARLLQNEVTKYNLDGGVPKFDAKGRQVILVPGQVVDDASLRFGAAEVRSNAALLAATRAANPEAFLIYKPHPDVVAGLRDGGEPVSGQDATLTDTAPAELFKHVDAVWTMTSLMGFEALLRGLPVICLGRPFYAGWGLTHDLTAQPTHRMARPSLLQLLQATLIDYPIYLDPVTKQICTVEHLLTRLEGGQGGARGPILTLLSKLQGHLIGAAHLWR